MGTYGSWERFIAIPASRSVNVRSKSRVPFFTVPDSRTLGRTRQKISAGSRLLVVGGSLDPIHSLVGKLGTVC
ncbi:hypothetical protein ABIB27_001478 [Arthrobacter sp. UYEF21]